MSGEGKYIYCIIREEKRRAFNSLGIGDRGDKVYTVNYKDLAAVVSNSPIKEYPVTRENTIAHEKVVEEVIRRGYTVLPVRFGTISEHENPEDAIKEKVLKTRYDEFKDLLKQMDGKIELGLKVLWNDMDKTFYEIENENYDIKRLKSQIVAQGVGLRNQQARIKIGEMVYHALEEKKKKEGGDIIKPLKRLAEDLKENPLLGDRMIVNSAFLVTKSNGKEFDKTVNELEEKHNQRMKFKYIGPVAPYNFVSIVVTWD